jgi:hypothetical protein
MLDNIQHTARYLRAFNRIIGSGQVLILGAIAPPLSLRDARTVRTSVVAWLAGDRIATLIAANGGRVMGWLSLDGLSPSVEKRRRMDGWG